MQWVVPAVIFHYHHQQWLWVGDFPLSSSCLSLYIYLFGGFNSSEKYEPVGNSIPNTLYGKITCQHVPKHQPATHTYMNFYGFPTSLSLDLPSTSTHKLTSPILRAPAAQPWLCATRASYTERLNSSRCSRTTVMGFGASENDALYHGKEWV